VRFADLQPALWVMRSRSQPGESALTAEGTSGRAAEWMAGEKPPHHSRQINPPMLGTSFLTSPLFVAATRVAGFIPENGGVAGAKGCRTLLV